MINQLGLTHSLIRLHFGLAALDLALPGFAALNFASWLMLLSEPESLHSKATLLHENQLRILVGPTCLIG